MHTATPEIDTEQTATQTMRVLIIAVAVIAVLVVCYAVYGVVFGGPGCALEAQNWGECGHTGERGPGLPGVGT